MVGELIRSSFFLNRHSIKQPSKFILLYLQISVALRPHCVQKLTTDQSTENRYLESAQS